MDDDDLENDTEVPTEITMLIKKIRGPIRSNNLKGERIHRIAVEIR